MSTNSEDTARFDRVTTLTTVMSLAEADDLCMKLEEQGIKTFIPDQYTASLTPLNACTLDGIRVQVGEQDLPRAREMLKGVLPQAASGMFTCPQCGSNSVGYAIGSKLLAVLSLFLLGLPLLWIGKRCMCKSCGCRWKQA